MGERMDPLGARMPEKRHKDVDMRYAGRTPCGVLGVAEGAPFNEVKKAYLRCARATHPDMPGGSAEAFREVQGAFEILRRRAATDGAQCRRSRPTPYDTWLSRPRASRQWTDDDPLLDLVDRPMPPNRRPTFAEILFREMRRRRADAA